jgi:predicted nucleotidyltransferase
MPYTAEDICSRVRSQMGQLQLLKVRKLGLFGSYARGDASSSSDVDFLVEFEDDASFDRYFELKELLEAQLNLPVDLVTKKAIKTRIFDLVKREIIYVC